MADVTLKLINAPEQCESNEKKHFQCDVCKKVFPQIGKLNQHLKYHTKPFACDICPEKYPSKNRLNRHLRLHAGLKPFECPICQRPFVCKFSMQLHINVHSSEKRFECDKCGKKFYHKQSRTSHKCCKEILKVSTNLSIMTSEISSSREISRPFKCPVCQKGFSEKSRMAVHSKLHSAESVTCPKCEKVFRHKNYFNKHKCSGKIQDVKEQVHAGKKYFTCDKCGKSLSMRSYKSHMYLHTGDSPFQCKVCLKRYCKPAALRDHVVIHSGVKKFFCNVCSKDFYRRKDLVAHLQNVNHEKIQDSQNSSGGYKNM